MLLASSVGLATIGVCIFCAAYFGSRTFCFIRRKKMKKTLAILLLVFAAMFSLSACNSEDEPNDTNTPTDQKTAFTITWLDENGNTLNAASVNEGEIPSYTYTVTDTAEWDLTFEGWSTTPNGDILSSVPAATANATYYAKVTFVKQKYTVTFNSMGGSPVASQTVEYGTKATLPETPTYEEHKFVGWSYSATDSNAVDFDQAIVGNVEYYAVWNKIVNIKALFSSLINGYSLNPLSYIPESMGSNYSENLVNAEDIVNDYSSFVNVSDISYGFGEQWHMVLENLEQSKMFFNVLSVVDTLSTVSVTSFNNYLDNNTADTAHHEFENGIYNVAIDFDGESIFYVLDYTAEIPLFGMQTIQIALAMNTETGEKYARIQIGDANALTYTMLENSYTFALKYAGVRRAMFSATRDNDGNVSGKIYEYLTISEAEVASAAEFYITEDYVSVVGNKASGMVGFTGYITELYKTENGKLLGYEVQESLSSIIYNTLWFNLSDIGGINTIKYQPASGNTPDKVFINGSSAAWETRNVGGLNVKSLSRRFDIEYRTQFVYSYDATNEKYVEHMIEVPMIFVQEENYDTFVSDVKATNNVTVNLNVANADLNRIFADYDTLVPIFIENKDLITPEVIIAFIGDKITFE